jgi:hypothetical protein
MNMIKTVSISILAMVFLSNTAYAEGEKLIEKLKQGTITISAKLKGCDADAAKYCPGLDIEGQKAFMCMMAYEESLSDSCKLGILERAIDLKRSVQAIEYSIMACEQDADTFCLDVQPGEGAIINCIKAHQTEVTPACITALKKTGIWDLTPDK